MSEASELRRIRNVLEQILRELENHRPSARAGKTRPSRDKAVPVGTPDPAVLEALVTFAVRQRRKFAQRKGWTRPVGYIPLADAEMALVATALPRTMDELAALPGFGDWKCRQFGNDLLNLVQAHRTDE